MTGLNSRQRDIVINALLDKVDKLEEENKMLRLHDDFADKRMRKMADALKMDSVYDDIPGIEGAEDK